jgi:hypothetical protein
MSGIAPGFSGDIQAVIAGEQELKREVSQGWF